MEIRRADITDLKGINKLLSQVLEVHHNARPDIFKTGAKKYTDSELEKIILDETKPIFVATEGDEVIGYAFCVIIRHTNHNIFTDIKTLYIDDLCVDENMRGRNIGKALYEYVLDFARQIDCYNVTLNVWSDNKGALAFYEKMELKSQKVTMEKIL